MLETEKKKKKITEVHREELRERDQKPNWRGELQIRGYNRNS